jgi:hypothetical protein
MAASALADETEHPAAQRDALFRTGFELVAFTHREQLELQAGCLGFGKHSRALQEDKAWLAPLGETPDTADDLVFRA